MNPQHVIDVARDVRGRWKAEIERFGLEINEFPGWPAPGSPWAARERILRDHRDNLIALTLELMTAIDDRGVSAGFAASNEVAKHAQAEDPAALTTPTFWQKGDRVVTRFSKPGTPIGTVQKAEIATGPVRANAFDDAPKVVTAEWVTIKWDDGTEDEYIASQVLKAPPGADAGERFYSQRVALGVHTWTDELRQKRMAWEGAKPDLEVLIVARVQPDEWAAYMEVPHLTQDISIVADHGIKIHEEFARHLWPQLAHVRYRL